MRNGCGTRMNDGYHSTYQNVLSTIGLRMSVKKCLYEGVIVRTALY